MANLQAAAVNLAFGDRDLLKDVSLNLGSGTRAALVGVNGSGKTTLMRILAGSVVPDAGAVILQKDASVSYLPQSGIVHSGTALLDEVERAFDPLRVYIAEAERVATELASHREDSPETRALLETLHHHQEHVQASGYYHRDQVIDEVLRGLGFSAADFERLTDKFSGGWQMRIALAKVLLERPDFLLLDEPTNYLDIEAREWLRSFIASFDGGVLLVSHDRHFLDATMNEVIELFNGRLARYRGNYSDYERKREGELQALLAAYQKQQDEIEHMEEFVRRFRYNESKAAMVQSRIKMLEKIVPIEIPESLKRMHFSFPPAPHSGRIMVRTEGLSKSYGSLNVLNGLDLTVTRGEKVAVVGRNGAGKSTLLRILASRDKDYAGAVIPGTGMTVGYFAQDAETTLDPSKTVQQLVEDACPTDLIPNVRGMLGAFLFRGDDVFKSVSVLSGGEKNRLALLTLLLHPANLLILDEPTNHLDLMSKDVLLDALRGFDGTVLFVSHDRYFIEGLASSVLELSCGRRARLFPGDYDYYRRRIETEAREAAREPETAERVGSTAGSRAESSR
ncbi:MAG: ABC-F family ATP-binding cassette domain-containing protein, partial [Candidatus Competibacteraceae bacterium]|nr:ABC-F family ATP-binding cassette domain-containing protein [Candidatus Competibacteraceae bacterium]